MSRNCLRRAIRAGIVCCAAAAAAETVTVNAPAGTSTNVTQVFTGDTTVAVNGGTGATGGFVRLSPHSTHTGGTTLGSGTLDVQQESQLGGSLTFLGGNFRYSGPAGAVWTTAITNSATTTAQNWRIDSDLTMAGDMWSTDGLFVKVFNPDEPTDTFSRLLPELPGGGISLLLDIQAIKSFKPIPQQGPHSQPGNIRIKSGDEGLRMRVWFDFQ